MNIQSGINQLLTTAGIATRLSPLQSIAENRSAGKELSAKAEYAQSGINEIAQNLENPQKQYTATELRDIESRVAEHNRNIYSAKTAADTKTGISKFINKGKLEAQPVYSEKLRSIESNLAKRREALDRMREQGNAKVAQEEEFGTIRDMILHPERYPKGEI